MPISSYLVHPQPGKGGKLAQRLASIPDCEVTPSKDGDLLVLVTDTAGDAAERTLQQTLHSLPELNGLALVFCHEAFCEEGDGEPEASPRETRT